MWYSFLGLVGRRKGGTPADDMEDLSLSKINLAICIRMSDSHFLALKIASPKIENQVFPTFCIKNEGVPTHSTHRGFYSKNSPFG